MRMVLTTVTVPLFLAWGALLLLTVPAFALEEGELTGRIERANSRFLRDYEKLDYKGQRKWEDWGRGRRSVGWIVLQGDSGELKDYLLLVIDTQTRIEMEDDGEGQFSDLGPGSRIRARYRMGWDALHALHVKRLNE